jgi:hypothetical protein
MSNSTYLSEAQACRDMAVEFSGRSEALLLVRIADSFETLAMGEDALSEGRGLRTALSRDGHKLMSCERPAELAVSSITAVRT